MLCKKPFYGKGFPTGCGQCMLCRLNTRRKKTTRILLESKGHESNCFATLTYDDEHLPRLKDGTPTLSVRDHQLFLKSLRRRLPPFSLRFYLVGEYGETTERPHYHAALFGIGSDSAALVQESWGKGFTHVGELERESAQYIAGYVTKKMTAEDDVRLNGRKAEYARMSNRGGGMGISAIKDIGIHLAELWGEFGLPDDVPREIGGLPLDRYARGKIRIITGVDREGKTPKAVLSRMREEARKDSEDVAALARDGRRGEAKALSKKIVETKRQKSLNAEYRMSLHKKGRRL